MISFAWHQTFDNLSRMLTAETETELGSEGITGLYYERRQLYKHQ